MTAAVHDDTGAVPLTILTGFLGAGKTTLLNRILAGDHGLRLAVLVNDFGSVNIDAELVVGVEDDMMSLANGCVCCQIRDDLVESIDRLLALPEPPEYIVLEASGVADPLSIWATFTDSGHRDRIRLDSVTCVVDAEQAFAHAEDHPELLMLKARQIGTADLVILNKVDLAGPAQVRRVRAWIDDLLNRVRIIESTHAEVPYDVLLAVGRFDPAKLPADAEDGHPGHDHGEQFATWSYEGTEPLSVEALTEMVSRRLPGAVMRCKGIVHVADEPDERLALNAVGRRTELTRLGPWGDEPPRTRIVAIGAAGRLDPVALDEAFAACRA